jgi:CheY-like chemotaxis protein
MISAATPSVTSDGDRDPTVLVVEEDAAARSFLAENLEADRYRVRTADSREKALAILSVQQPDVIVVDVNGKTLDLIDAIRGGDGLAGRVDPDTPLIVLTTRVESFTGSGCSTVAATTCWPSRTPTPSFAPGSPRCFAAPGRAARRGCSASAG